MFSGYEIGVSTQAELRPALSLVLRTLPADQRAPLVDSLARLRDEPLAAFQALVVARRAGKVAAACWGQPQPGKSCSLWTPQAETGEAPADLADAMIALAVKTVDAAGVSVTQTLAEVSHGPMHVPLERNGFCRVAELHYLQWTPSRNFPAPSDTSLEFQAFDPRKSKRLERVVAETYQQTLDFPELDGMRDLRDVISGYQCVGEPRPELWDYLVWNGQDAGVLLLCEHPDTSQLELVYMGVTPTARGRGFGAVAVSRAQRTALERGVGRMVLAVDARNQPAENVYRRAGFRQWANRFAYLRAPRAASTGG